MNCDHVDELLPLYTGGDLDEGRSRLLATHLQSCVRCARAADEYAEVKELWQEFESPQFSEAVYAGIRRRVLSEIEQPAQAPRWTGVISELFATWLQPRALWVTVTLLLATLLAASYFIVYRSRQSTNHQATLDHGVAAPDIRKRNALAPPRENSPAIPLPSKGTKPVTPGNSLRPRRPAVVAVTRRIKSAPVLPVRMIEVERDVSGSSSASVPLRVEIQTRDRNIRIIWLSGQRPQDGPKDPAKGI